MIQQAAWDWAFLQDYLRFFITGVTILVRIHDATVATIVSVAAAICCRLWPCRRACVCGHAGTERGCTRFAFWGPQIDLSFGDSVASPPAPKPQVVEGLPLAATLATHCAITTTSMLCLVLPNRRWWQFLRACRSQ